MYGTTTYRPYSLSPDAYIPSPGAIDTQQVKQEESPSPRPFKRPRDTAGTAREVNKSLLAAGGYLDSQTTDTQFFGDFHPSPNKDHLSGLSSSNALRIKQETPERNIMKVEEPTANISEDTNGFGLKIINVIRDDSKVPYEYYEYAAKYFPGGCEDVTNITMAYYHYLRSHPNRTPSPEYERNRYTPTTPVGSECFNDSAFGSSPVKIIEANDMIDMKSIIEELKAARQVVVDLEAKLIQVAAVVVASRPNQREEVIPTKPNEAGPVEEGKVTNLNTVSSHQSSSRSEDDVTHINAVHRDPTEDRPDTKINDMDSGEPAARNSPLKDPLVEEHGRKDVAYRFPPPLDLDAIMYRPPTSNNGGWVTPSPTSTTDYRGVTQTQF
ncbi:hypothetical protein SCHPADRAFT_940644 [Schizopora paradoxa]|uniref:Uncharacterized protein n=1 Tax=Schizopora paradoxa TaxID=27342 RepID=A0A0H2RNI7_9AGAM|nr:hypothetical protein SCHPADRAFT_940644 [Schizopora paradoxa]